MKFDQEGSGFSSANRRRNNGRDPRKDRRICPSTKHLDWGCRARLRQKTAAGMGFEHLQAIERPEASTGMLRVHAYSPWTGEVRKSHGKAMVLDRFPQYQAPGAEILQIARRAAIKRVSSGSGSFGSRAMRKEPITSGSTFRSGPPNLASELGSAGKCGLRC